MASDNKQRNCLDSVRLVPAGPDDARKIFRLRNHPSVIMQSEGRREVDWAEHSAWYADRVAHPDLHRIFLIEENRDTVGVIRFDRTNAHSARISIYLVQNAVGRGIGTHSIRAASQEIGEQWGLVSISALVRRGNDRSLAAFAKIGFVNQEGRQADGEMHHLELKLSRANLSHC